MSEMTAPTSTSQFAQAAHQVEKTNAGKPERTRQPDSNNSSMSEPTENAMGSAPRKDQKNSKHGTRQRLEQKEERSSIGTQRNASFLDFLLSAMPTGKSQEQRLKEQALRLHSKIRGNAAVKAEAIRNYFLEEEGIFNVADVDWVIYRLLDADLNHVYSAVGEAYEEEVFVFDKSDRPVFPLAEYVPQTKIGRWWLTCQTARTPSDFARFVSGTAGTLFVKLNPPWDRFELFDCKFRNLAENTIEAALKKFDLGELVQGEGQSSLWFRTPDLELAALIVERTLETCGLLQGSSIMDSPENDSKMPQVFYPRHRRRVVTKWGF